MGKIAMSALKPDVVWGVCEAPNVWSQIREWSSNPRYWKGCTKMKTPMQYYWSMLKTHSTAWTGKHSYTTSESYARPSLRAFEIAMLYDGSTPVRPGRYRNPIGRRTTQGDPLGMGIYAIGTSPLLDLMAVSMDESDEKEVAFADDITTAGRVNGLRRWWDELSTRSSIWILSKAIKIMAHRQTWALRRSSCYVKWNQHPDFTRRK